MKTFIEFLKESPDGVVAPTPIPTTATALPTGPETRRVQ
jgi:hypothetical protein